MRRTDRTLIANLRLAAQQLAGSTLTAPADVATAMLALQAQDLSSAQWALAVRSPSTTLADVDRAFDTGAIVRSWPFRGTLHVTPAVDLGWMLELTRDRIVRGAATRHAGLGLDESVFARAADVVRGALQYASATAAASLAQDLENGLRRELFAKVMRLRFRWHDENRSGKTIARSLRDMEKARHFFHAVAFGYVELALLVLGVLALSFADRKSVV